MTLNELYVLQHEPEAYKIAYWILKLFQSSLTPNEKYILHQIELRGKQTKKIDKTETKEKVNIEAIADEIVKEISKKL